MALITGSDSGIGQATAVEFAEEGADVVVTYFDGEDGARETVCQVEAAGRRALLRQLDVTDEAAIESVFDDTIAEFGGVDILMNNASIDSTGKQIADLELEAWDRALRTNLTGPMLCCRRFIRERRKAGGRGKIINVTSVHDEIPRPGAAEYCAGKGGLQNLTRTLALELAPDRINVNNIGPGMVLTPMKPGGARRSQGARGAGGQHPVEAGSRAAGGRAPGGVPRVGRRGLPIRLDLLPRRCADAEPGPGA